MSFPITAVIGTADTADKAFATILDSVTFDRSGGVAVEEFQFDDGNCKFVVSVAPSELSRVQSDEEGLTPPAEFKPRGSRK